MKTYNKFVYEGRGISEINKLQTLNIFNLFKNKSYGNYSYKILNKYIIIEFAKSNNYDSLFYIENKIWILHFDVPENNSDNKLKEIISHELNHLIEVYNLKNKQYPNYNKIKKSLMLFKPKTNSMLFFKTLVYKTLDNEINANVAQTYTYLKNLNISKEELLKLELENYDVRKSYIDIINYDSEKFLNNVDKEEFNQFINILLNQNVHLFFNFIISDDINFIIKKWMKIIKNNAKKLIIKQNNIIKEIIEDYSTGINTELNEKLKLRINKYIREEKIKRLI